MPLDDDAYMGARGALPIPDDTTVGDLDQEPETGEQYMLRVRLESQSAPRVTIDRDRDMLIQKSTKKNVAQPPTEELELVPEFARPLPEWLDAFAVCFRRQRQIFVAQLQSAAVPGEFKLPDNGSPKEWRNMCYSA
ncbi:hypothetical protein EC988_009076, partial [Linderina pennispora]